jgi:tetratricopeptide (TPR) repeat protein
VYCYLAFYLQNKHSEVLALIKNKKIDIVNNLSLAYMASNLAINDKQIDYAKNIILNRNKSNEYLQIAAWDYELAYVSLYKQEFQEAAKHFETYLANFKGNFYVKDIYLKLSWCYYLQGNIVAAEAARANVLNKGALYTDADKQALQEAKTGAWANITLLKARLLNDGGMNKEALQILNTKGVASFTKEEEKLQFTYRYARIHDDMRNDAEAIQYYLKTIEIGATRKEYFAARAALQLGEIYERQNKKTIAVSYFQQCIAMKDHEYKNSLDQKAKSGIARCTGE